MTLLIVAVAAMSFTLSACVGLGGSLILVPALALLLGTKAGVALAGLLLAVNNVAKVFAYRRTIPIKPALGVAFGTGVGSWVGASLLVAAPTEWVSIAVVGVIASSAIIERADLQRVSRATAPGFAIGAGLTSGFAGTSGPLKGLAVRGLTGDRQHLAGGASVVSLVGDIAKVGVFWRASLLDGSLPIAGWALLAIPFTTVLGHRLNRDIGERAYRVVFWSVMLGYSMRLLALLPA